MSEYTSIKEEVLMKLEANLPEIRERFGIETIETIGIFGSVSREEDGPDSDIDILYTFKPEFDSYNTFFDLSEYLEELFGRRIDLVSPDYLKPRIRSYVLRDAIICKADKAKV